MRLLKALTLIGVTAGALLAGASGAMAQTTLKYSPWLPVNHWLNVNGMQAWIAQVEKATNGRVKIEVLPKVVGSATTQIDVARDGLADIVLIVTAYTPGRFQLSEIGELPFLGDDPAAMSPAYYRFYKANLEKYAEFKGVHVLSIFTTSPGNIFTSKRQIKNVGDISGLKLRIPGVTAANAVAAMGAVPVQKPSSEVYDLLSTGVLDGTVLFREGPKGNNLIDLLHYGLMVPGGLYNAVLGVMINQDKWNALSKQDQEAISSVSGEHLATLIGKAYREADRVGVEAMKEKGYVLEAPDSALLAELKKRLAPLDEAWIEKAKKRGVPDPAALLTDLRQKLAAAKAPD